MCPKLKENEKIECHRLHMEVEMGAQGVLMPTPFASAQSSMPMPSTFGSSEVVTRGKRKMSGGEKPGSV